MKIFMGGTYDPVHHGHLRAALELSELFHDGQGSPDSQVCVHLLPCFQPVHRGTPSATSEQRVEMLLLSTAEEPRLIVDQREIERRGPSYTVDSLNSMRREYGDQEPIVLVLGSDAFNALPSWHQWHQLMSLCHIVVLHRPGTELLAEDQLGALLELHKAQDFSALFEKPAGSILPLELTRLEISSSQVRAAIMDGHSARYLVPDSVWQFINDNHLYKGC